MKCHYLTKILTTVGVSDYIDTGKLCLLKYRLDVVLNHSNCDLYSMFSNYLVYYKYVPIISLYTSFQLSYTTLICCGMSLWLL